MVKTASLYDNFCKTGNYVIYDVIIWVQDGNFNKMALENFSIGVFYNITKNQDNPIKTVGWDSFLSPQTPKIQFLGVTQPPGDAQPLYSLGDTTRPRHITHVLVWSKSDQRRLRKTLHKQTNKQTDRQTDKPTDTTKIMVTWTWTNFKICFMPCSYFFVWNNWNRLRQTLTLFVVKYFCSGILINVSSYYFARAAVAKYCDQ